MKRASQSRAFRAGFLPAHRAAWFIALMAAAIPRLAPETQAAPTAEQIEFFEKKIRPVLISECYECHGDKAQKGGLRVDYRDALLQGGDSGPALVPGDAKKSLLVQSVTYEHPDLKMPKKRPRLDQKVVADLAAWVDMGAPDPRTSAGSSVADANAEWPAKLDTRRQWWSFQPVKKPGIPAVKNQEWSAHPVDRFILAKLEEQQLEPASSADKRSLIRRATFALTGLPPTPEQVEQFVNDTSPDAYERLVDRLLASPQFGEKWARHWMDLVRYADSHGSEGDPEIPHAWRYRDYLIRALNTDVPWDQLIREHIAGDLLPNPRMNTAEGFNESILGAANLRFVEHGFQPIDVLDEQVKVVDNQIDVLGKAFQGLTISCARCHDHKFDPISQEDFYALFGVFASSRPALVTIDTPERLRVFRDDLQRLKSEIKSGLAQAWSTDYTPLSAKLASTIPEDAPAYRLSSEAQMKRQITQLENKLAAIEQTARQEIGKRRSSPGADNAARERAPLAVWTFDENAADQNGRLNGELIGGATIINGRLVLNGKGAFVRTAPLSQTVREKTLEAWVALPNLSQRGGGVITLETSNGSVFDSIVFGEQEEKKWAAGSDFANRTRSVGGPSEAAGPTELLHLAIVYSADNSIQIFRNGVPYGSAYTPNGEAGKLRSFEEQKARVLFGLRHTGGGNGFLTGEIEEARLYDRALTAAEIKTSFDTGPTLISPEQIAEALSSDQRAERERLLAELRQLRSEFHDRFPDYERKEKARTQWTKNLEQAASDRLHPLHLWAVLRGQSDSELAERWKKAVADVETEMASRRKANAEKFKPAWDFTSGSDAQWFKYGANPPEVVAHAGEFCIEPEGEKIISNIFPPGVYSHLLSQRHNGVFTSPRFKVETDSISLRVLGGKGARVRLIVDNYPLGNPGNFPQADLNSTGISWLRLDTSYRKGTYAYLEFAPAEDLAAFSRVNPGPGNRSFFGVQKIVFHDGPNPPSPDASVSEILAQQDAPQSVAELASRYDKLFAETVAAWRSNELDEPRRAFLDSLTGNGWVAVTTNEVSNLASLVTQYRSLEAKVPVPRRAPGVVEAVAYDAPFMPRGDHLKPTNPVHRRYLEVLDGKPYQTRLSGRLELARDLTDPHNPLTARVMVNRIWYQLFGRGLVATVDNFGLLGEKPSHPELLDYLAARFMESGWSAKEMIRFLAGSRTYQMGSAVSARAREVDPSNQLLSHMNVRRLDAEAIYDSLLAVSGRLDSTLYGVGFNPNSAPAEQKRRSVYTAVRRTSLSPFLETFNVPKPFTTQGRRETTNVPAQSLTLLNDPLVAGLALDWARSVIAEGGETDARVRRMFERTLSRPPSETERAASRHYLAELAQEHRAGENLLASEAVWTDFAQSLFNLKEFIYLR